MSDLTTTTTTNTTANTTFDGTTTSTTPLYYTTATYTVDTNLYNTIMKKQNNSNSNSFSWCVNDNKHSFDFEYIKEIVAEKVYEFTFHDNSKVKTIRREEDPFDLEYMFYLALAKKFYSRDYTFEGVLSKSYTIQFEKKYIKAVKKGIKLFNKLKEEELKKKEYDEMKKRQHEKHIRRKKEVKERKRKEQINILAEAIRLSKEEG